MVAVRKGVPYTAFNIILQPINLNQMNLLLQLIRDTLYMTAPYCFTSIVIDKNGHVG